MRRCWEVDRPTLLVPSSPIQSVDAIPPPLWIPCVASSSVSDASPRANCPHCLSTERPLPIPRRDSRLPGPSDPPVSSVCDPRRSVGGRSARQEELSPSRLADHETMTSDSLLRGC